MASTRLSNFHQIMVEDHDVGSGSHLWRELNYVQGLLLELTSKNLQGSIFSFLSLLFREVSRVIDQISRSSWIDSLETMNSLPLTQQLMSSPSTNALAKNSLMMHSYTSPIGFNNLVHVLSLNTSGMNVSFKDLMSTFLSKTIKTFCNDRCMPC